MTALSNPRALETDIYIYTLSSGKLCICKLNPEFVQVKEKQGFFSREIILFLCTLGIYNKETYFTCTHTRMNSYVL